jgi:hypothetical protein
MPLVCQVGRSSAVNATGGVTAAAGGAAVTPKPAMTLRIRAAEKSPRDLPMYLPPQA